MANLKHINLLRQGVEKWNRWRQKNSGTRPDLSGALISGVEIDESDFSDNTKQVLVNNVNLHCVDFSNTDLSGAYLHFVDLQDANLYKGILVEASLIEAGFRNADMRKALMTEADLSGAFLASANLNESNLCRVNLSNAYLLGTRLNSANIRGGNLTRAYCMGADFSSANLCEADLTEALLRGTQLLKTNLTAATLTGAHVQDWNTNNGTRLDDVLCEYVYLKSALTEKEEGFEWIGLERRPRDPNKIFAPREFESLFKVSIDTVDLIFREGINWQAFFQSFQELKSKYSNDLSIQAVERKNGEDFVVRLEVSPEVNKEIVEIQAKELYTHERKLLEDKYRAELHIKECEIESYKRESANMMKIAELLAGKPITIEAKAVAESQSDSDTFRNDLRQAKIGNFANQVLDSARQQTNQYNYDSSDKQTLAEAAEEIQKLLVQLEQANPSATYSEMIAYVNDETTPILKRRTTSALKACGEAAIDEFVLENKFLKVLKATVKGWLEEKH